MVLKTKKLNGDPAVSTLPVACFSSDHCATHRFRLIGPKFCINRYERVYITTWGCETGFQTGI